MVLITAIAVQKRRIKTLDKAHTQSCLLNALSTAIGFSLNESRHQVRSTFTELKEDISKYCSVKLLIVCYILSL